jgi:hypothetical protein
MAADALRQSAYAASGPEEAKETTCPRRSANTQATTASRRCTPASRRANPATPCGRPKKTLPALLLAALNERVFVMIDGKRRKITKREVIVTQMVNNAAGADLRATKMLVDMMKDIERKAGVAAPPEPRRFAPAAEQVIKHSLERIRGARLQEIQDMNLGNPALAMISLPPAEPVSVLVRHPCRLRCGLTGRGGFGASPGPLPSWPLSAVERRSGASRELERVPVGALATPLWCFLPGRSRRRRRT